MTQDPARIHVREVASKDGRRFAAVELRISDGGWSGHYSFLTDGMTPEEVRAKHDAILVHHTKKAARMDALMAMNLRPKVGGVEFEIRAGIVEVGTDVKLILRVITDDGTAIKLDIVRPDVASLPSDGEIATMVRDAALTHLSRRQVGINHVNAVKQVLGV